MGACPLGSSPDSLGEGQRRTPASKRGLGVILQSGFSKDISVLDVGAALPVGFTGEFKEQEGGGREQCTLLEMFRIRWGRI